VIRQAGDFGGSTGGDRCRYGHPVVTSAAEALGAAAAAQLARFDGRECRIDPGLTDAEIARVEGEFGFEFADDHRAFLAAGLPLSVPYDDPPGVIRTNSDPWPNWRDGDPEVLRERLNWPVEGLLFDVEHNVYWDAAWGERPEDRSQALEIARHNLADVPKLVPLYGHRFLPAGHGTYGHLVLSVWQTDIICYGADLSDYIEREFGAPQQTLNDATKGPRATVAFWRDFV
jgi:hypothetical protein